MALKYLTQRVAQKIDEELMSQAGGFSIDQLMELAGLSVAQAVAKVYSKQTHSQILVCCGPGNNGGDGLVAARHLSHFGYNPSIFYPKQAKKDLYERLVTQCNNLNIPFVNELTPVLSQTNLILDAIFGFSFSGEIRPPFGEVIQVLKETKVPIVSVDIPSGWDLEKGNINNRSFTPVMLISLTAPKLCAQHFKGIHYLGGRFVTPELEKKFGLHIPAYPGIEQVVDISNLLIENL
ncbi:hypothetical protein G9A89_023960 [Geosiphon pyriformis]|nr:hypothetical protein G9A89_023960 [Geosiphon pyriformis]